MIHVTHKGDLRKTYAFLHNAKEYDYRSILERYGNLGVQALSAATPVDSGETAASWGYEIEIGAKQATITWTNANVNRGINIALILDKGHGTGTGGYVLGRNYILPAIQPIFDEMAEQAWKEIVEL